jgi:hypothetical protein
MFFCLVGMKRQVREKENGNKYREKKKFCNTHNLPPRLSSRCRADSEIQRIYPYYHFGENQVKKMMPPEFKSSNFLGFRKQVPMVLYFDFCPSRTIKPDQDHTGIFNSAQ